MSSKIIIKVSPDHSLEIPQEIRSQLQTNSEYEITFNQEKIILKKISEPAINEGAYILRPSSGKSILRHAGTWKGDDFEECLQAVYDNRSEIDI